MTIILLADSYRGLLKPNPRKSDNNSLFLCLLNRASLWELKNERPTWCLLLYYFTSYVLNMFRTLIYLSSGACDYSVELPQAEACNTDTTPTQPHRNSNTHRTKNNTTNVVIQQNSRKLLMMDILMSETYWAQKKWNKIASDVKLVFYSSTITALVFSLRPLTTQKGFNFRSVKVGPILETVSLGPVCLRVLPFFMTVSFHKCSIFIFRLSTTDALRF